MDIERAFRKYGRIESIDLKAGFGFIVSLKKLSIDLSYGIKRFLTITELQLTLWMIWMAAACHMTPSASSLS